MKAAVFRGVNDVRVEDLPTPPVGAGEVLVQVEACGVCGTDLKKIAHGDLAPPLVFGHEVGGRVAAVGPGVTRFKLGDRVLFFHHIPCRSCSFCRSKDFAQCPQYKRVGTTAGFEPAGGGFAEFVRVMDWIVREGLVKIPEGIDAEEATFVEPVNTCLKGIQKAGISEGKSVLIFGAGPVGLLLLQLARLKGASVSVVDPIPERLEVARTFGAAATFPVKGQEGDSPLRGQSSIKGQSPLNRVVEGDRAGTVPGAGAGTVPDVALVATAAPQAIGTALEAIRPAGRVVLFAQTRVGDMAPIDVGQIGKLEKELIGSYSASVDLQEEAADLVFRRKIQVKPLITHRFGLDQIQEAIRVALNPSAQSLKVIVKPNEV